MPETRQTPPILTPRRCVEYDGPGKVMTVAYLRSLSRGLVGVPADYHVTIRADLVEVTPPPKPKEGRR